MPVLFFSGVGFLAYTILSGEMGRAKLEALGALLGIHFNGAAFYSMKGGSVRVFGPPDCTTTLGISKVEVTINAGYESVERSLLLHPVVGEYLTGRSSF